MIVPEVSGKNHAAHSVSATVATMFRRQCYGPPSPKQQTLYKNLEQRRKEIEFQYLKDPNEEMKLLHTVVKRFHPAFLPNDEDAVGSRDGSNGYSQMHRKKKKSTVNTIYSYPSSVISAFDSATKLAFTTNLDKNNTQQWTWRPAGHFSSRGTTQNQPFRINFLKSMRQKLHSVPLQMGRQSGMFWYPPGSVREWHTNYLDLVGNTKKDKTRSDAQDEEIFASQVWRMYFVRTVRDAEFDDKLRSKQQSFGNGAVNNATVDDSVNDHSAMHIIPGDDKGITLDVLKKAGARPLTPYEQKRQWSDIFAQEDESKQTTDPANNEFDRNSVWRIPDQDGFVTIFRLPKLWHCIVSEEVHRYSLGFAFSDREVQALLKLAGVQFDVESENDTNLQHDEL